MSQNRVMIGSQSGHDRGGRMKDTVQEVRHLSAHSPRTGHGTASSSTTTAMPGIEDLHERL